MTMDRKDFWNEVLALNGSVTPFIRMRVLIFGIWGALVWWIWTFPHIDTGMGVAHYEIVGVVLALLLVLRTNSGYDRWWEGRKIWGGIVNQSRNLAMIGVAYGPDDPKWRNAYLRWTAAFPHLSRHSLRNERDISDLAPLLEPAEIEELERADHMPMYASMRIADLLQEARDNDALDGFAYLAAEEQRARLIDHIGACERILNTPLAKVVSIKIRRFLLLYLLLLPLAIVDRAGVFTPLLQMLVAYPLLSLDQIGKELENPFSLLRLSHLPLQTIGETIERNVLALERQPQLIIHNGRRTLNQEPSMAEVV